MTALDQNSAPVTAVGRVRDVGTRREDAAPLLYWRGAYLPAGDA